jgi:hypothetical protein
MKLNILFLCFAIYAFSFIANCSPSAPEVSGDVFIVTKGGTNIKLGLVEIFIYKENNIKPYIKSKYEFAKAKILPLQADLNKMKHEVEKLKKECDETTKHEDRYKDIDDEKYTADLHASREIIYKYSDKYNEFHKTYDELSRYVGAEYYIRGLPIPMLTTKTDADGKFTINLKSGKYALIASASRTIGEDKEVYYWLIWVSVKPNQRNNIMLSNDNLFENNTKDNLINLTELR